VWKCSADWRVKYGDFGLANKPGNNTMITGSKRGHEDYEPPVRGDLSQVGTRRAHDMWAVGCVVAEMVLKQTVTELGVKCPRNSEAACAQFIARVVERDPEIGSIVERLLTWENEDRMDAVDFREAVLQVVGSAEECKRQQMQAQLQIPLGSSKSKSVSEALHTHRASRLREAEFRSRKLSWPGSMPAIAEEEEENHHQQQRALSTGSTNSSAMLSEQSLEDTTPSLVPSARSTEEQDSLLSSARRRRQQRVTWDEADKDKANYRFDDGSAAEVNRSVKHMQHFALSRAFLQWQTSARHAAIVRVAAVRTAARLVAMGFSAWDKFVGAMKRTRDAVLHWQQRLVLTVFSEWADMVGSEAAALMEMEGTRQRSFEARGTTPVESEAAQGRNNPDQAAKVALLMEEKLTEIQAAHAAQLAAMQAAAEQSARQSRLQMAELEARVVQMATQGYAANGPGASGGAAPEYVHGMHGPDARSPPQWPQVQGQGPYAYHSEALLPPDLRAAPPAAFESPSGEVHHNPPMHVGTAMYSPHRMDRAQHGEFETPP
jgi:hypothetical protein